MRPIEPIDQKDGLLHALIDDGPAPETLRGTDLLAALENSGWSVNRRAEVFEQAIRQSKQIHLRRAAHEALGSMALKLGLADDAFKEAQLDFAVLDSKDKAQKKRIRQMHKAHAERLDRALRTSRVWPGWRWRMLFVEHPVLAAVSPGLIFDRISALGNVTGTLMLDSDGMPIDDKGELAVPDDDEMLRLAHPLTLSAENIKRFAALLKKSRAKPLVKQLDREIYGQEDESFADILDRMELLFSMTLFKDFEKFYYMRGRADEEHGQVFCDHCLYLGDDLFFRVEHSPLPHRFAQLGREEKSDLRHAIFLKLGKEVPARDIDPIAYSEIMREFRRLCRVDKTGGQNKKPTN